MTAAMIAAEAGVAAAPQENLLHPSRWPSWMTTPREAHASSAAKSPAATQKTNKANAPADHAALPAPSRRNDGAQPGIIPVSCRHRRSLGNRRLRRPRRLGLAPVAVSADLDPAPICPPMPTWQKSSPATSLGHLPKRLGTRDCPCFRVDGVGGFCPEPEHNSAPCHRKTTRPRN